MVLNSEDFNYNTSIEDLRRKTPDFSPDESGLNWQTQMKRVRRKSVVVGYLTPLAIRQLADGTPL